MTNKQIIMRAITNKKPFTQAPDILHLCDSFHPEYFTQSSCEFPFESRTVSESFN